VILEHEIELCGARVLGVAVLRSRGNARVLALRSQLFPAGPLQQRQRQQAKRERGGPGNDPARCHKSLDLTDAQR
jgi:hypothetical protein